MAWLLKTPICTFAIRLFHGHFALYVGDELLQTASSPEALADNVYTHTSEYYEWDISDCEVGNSLLEWSRIETR